MLQQVLIVVTPVFIIAAIGYAWVKLKQPFDNNTVSSLVMFIGSPCLIYSSLTSNPPETDALLNIVAAATFAIAASAVIGLALVKMLGWQIRTYLPSLVHANTGNMGLPLVLLAFGDEGLALGMAFFFVNSISQFTVGLSISSGKFSLASLGKQPVIWAVVLTLVVIFTDTAMPSWFDATTQLLGGLTIPAMLLMLGTSLARFKAGSIKQTTAMALARLLIGFAIGHLIVCLFDLEGMIAGVIILQSTMPAAVFNYVFADRYDREPDKVAAVVLQSTLASLATLPLLVGYVLTL